LPAEIPQPYNEEAERLALGAMILSPDSIAQIRTFLAPSDFFIKRNEIICSVIYGLEDKNLHIDFDSVIAELGTKNLLESVGGYDAIIALEELVFDSSLGEQHARQVQEKAKLREIITILNNSIKNANSGEESASDIVKLAQEALHRISIERNEKDFQAIADISERVIEDIISRRGQLHGVSGVRTGYKVFDEKTGGLQNSDLIILAARPSVGKTAFALNLAVNIGTGRAYSNDCRKFMPNEARAVGVFSLEMSDIQVTQRMLSTLSEVPMYQMRTGQYTNSDLEIISSNSNELSACPIYIDDTAGISVTEFRAKALRLLHRCKYDADLTGNPNRELSLIIIDYLQLMRGRTDKKNESRQQEVSEISRSIKELARELNIPIIALSQLSRAIEQRKGKNALPQLSDLRESGAIEQDADVVLFLHREKDINGASSQQNGSSNQRSSQSHEPESEEANLIISKQRNGPIGKINLIFHKSTATFFSGLTNDF